MLDRLVADGELCQVVANHVGFNLHLCIAPSVQSQPLLRIPLRIHSDWREATPVRSDTCLEHELRSLVVGSWIASTFERGL